MISMLSSVTPGAISNPARRMAVWLTGWGYSLIAWGERRTAIKALRKLDDRELRDIGLHRHQIEAAVYCFTCAEAELGRFG